MGRSYTYHTGVTGDFNKTNFNMDFRVVCKSQQLSRQPLPAIAERLLSTFTRDKLALPKCPENAFSGMSISRFFQGNMPPNPPKRIGPLDSFPPTLTKPRPTWKLK